MAKDGMLSAYLTRENLTPTAFAARLGVPPSTITRVLKGSRGIGPKLALRIQEATGGAVSAHALRPDIWAAPKGRAAA